MIEALSPYDTTQLAIIFVALLVSAFFSGTETAITGLGSLKAKHLMEQGSSAKRQLNLWLTHPGRVLTTILIFNNLFHILASAVATDFATRHLQSQAIGIATGVMTLLILFFVEIIPKSFAKTHAERVAIPALRIIYAIYLVVAPLVWLVSGFALRVVGKLGGIRQDTPPITEEELEYLVNVGERAGVLEETKKEMIVGVFEFDETKVREIMTPRPDVKWLSNDASLGEALALAVESGMSRIPVCENGAIDNVIGILLVKDLLKVARDQQRESTPFSVKKIMRAPFFVPESKPVMDVFKELKSSKNHIAIVIDEHGGTAGLVTMEDILEEIVGEIQDEYDTEEAEILETEPGVFDVAGSCNIDEFLEHFGIEEEDLKEKPDEGTDTIAGWIVALLGDLPAQGEKLRIGPLNLEVTEVERQRIRRVKVTATKPVQEDPIAG